MKSSPEVTLCRNSLLFFVISCVHFLASGQSLCNFSLSLSKCRFCFIGGLDSRGSTGVSSASLMSSIGWASAEREVIPSSVSGISRYHHRAFITWPCPNVVPSTYFLWVPCRYQDEVRPPEMYQRQILSEKNFASSASIHVGAIVSYPSKALSFLGQQGWTLSCHFLFSLVLLGLMNNTKLKEKLIIVVLRVNRKLFIFYCSIICLLFLLPPAPELLNTFTFQNVKHYMFSSLLNSCFHY